MKRTMWCAMLSAGVFVLGFGFVPALAQEQADQETRRVRQIERREAASGAIRKGTKMHKVWRASQMLGTNVQNEAGEDLGEVEDLVVDLTSGKVRYAAISFGGFLGLGDKLFAVPMSALKIHMDDDDNAYFVLHVDKERLKSAPGFNEDAWPDFANPQWGAEVEKFYGTSIQATPLNKGMISEIDEGKLTISSADGDVKETYELAPNLKITLDGQPVKLADLKENHHVSLTFDNRAGKNVVTGIQANSKLR